jgi:transposase
VFWLRRLHFKRSFSWGVKNAFYDTSLTDAQWDFIQPMLPKPSKLGRPPTHKRIILDAILYVVKGGVPWRLLPHDFPPWQTVYDIFRKWTLNHQWAALNEALRTLVRREHDKGAEPTAAILDSQSVKSDGHGGNVGYDAAKKIKGRKRHMLVDTLGLVLGVTVTPASTPEREGAQKVLDRVAHLFTKLRRLWVDGGYTGDAFAQWVKELCPELEVEVVKRSDNAVGFEVLPRRWVVERTFGWLMRHRRLARDYEKTETSAESFIYIAMIRTQLRRLA